MTDTELFKRYRETGDEKLRNEIVEQNLYIAAMLAKKFVGRGVEYDDLYQVASLALIKGVERFDERKGLQFSTFITPTITGEIKNYFRDRSRMIRLPRRLAELRGTVKKAYDELLSETGKTPTAKDIAERVGCSEEEAVQAMEAGLVVSLDRPVDADEDKMSFYDIIPSDDHFADDVEQKVLIDNAMKKLNDTEREIIRLRYNEECSQTETARRMGVSQMFVSRMERKILEKMRVSIGDGAL